MAGIMSTTLVLYRRAPGRTEKEAGQRRSSELHLRSAKVSTAPAGRGPPARGAGHGLPHGLPRLLFPLGQRNL